MRNRFRPNVTPRSSRHSGPSSRTSVSSSTSLASRSSVSDPQESQREEEPAVFIPPNSSKALDTGSTEEDLNTVEVTAIIKEPEKSIPKATTTETTARTRRSRIKPSVTPTGRTRRKPASEAAKTTTQETNELSSAAAGEEVAATSTKSTTTDTTQSKDTSTINSINKPEPKTAPSSNTQPETPSESPKQTRSSTNTAEGSQPSTGSLLARRKRAIPNIGAAARRRPSLSVSKESISDKGTIQPESSVSQETEEASEKTIPENEEVEERGNKRPRTASEPLLDNIIGVAEVTVESTTTGTQLVDEEILEEDEEETANKRVEEKKRKPRYSRPKEPLDPSKMTLQDLIYFNPKDNPMKSSVNAKRRKIENKRKGSQSTENENGDANTSEVDGQDTTDQCNTTTEPAPSTDTLMRQGEDEGRVHAPQVKIGADGCIILDEESLVIKSTPNSTLEERDIVYEDSNNLNYDAYFRNVQSKRTKWSMPETLKFYKALSQVGTDFSLMLPLFPNRKRRELKAKFKREEKVHQDLVDRALVHRTPITIEMFKRTDKPEEDILDDITSGNDDRNNSTAK